MVILIDKIYTINAEIFLNYFLILASLEIINIKKSS